MGVILGVVLSLVSGCSGDAAGTSARQSPSAQPARAGGDDGIDAATLSAIMAEIPDGWVAVKVRVTNAAGEPVPNVRVGFHRQGDFNVFKGGDTDERGEIATAAPIGTSAELMVVRLRGEDRDELYRDLVTVPEDGGLVEVAVDDG